MAQLGTDVFFFWDLPAEESVFSRSLDGFLTSEGMRLPPDSHATIHRYFGNIYFGYGPVKKEVDSRVNKMRVEFLDVEMLPELASDPPPWLRPESAARYAYYFVKRMFVALEADLCCGATLADEVPRFDLENPSLWRLFRFTRKGPQKLIAPFEENRRVGESRSGLRDLSIRNKETGECNWNLFSDGPLDIGSYRR